MSKWQFNQVLGLNQGKAIVSDLYIQPHKAPVLIISHGFKSFKNWGAYDRIADFFVSQGFSLVKYNFSHNGGTENDPYDFPDLESFAKNTYALELADLQIVIDFVSEATHTVCPDIVLLGHSRGGAIAAIGAIEEPRVRALITWNGVAQPAQRLDAHDNEQWSKEGVIYIPNSRTGQNMPLNYSLYEDAQLNAERYNILSRAREFRGEALFIHAQDDETIAFSDAQALNGAFTRSELFAIKSGGHTLGQRHPDQPSEPLPTALQSALDKSAEFIRSLG